MKDIRKHRNIGISAHIDSGKTTLTERMLFYTGRIHRIGEVKGSDDQGATMDFMDLEKERGITIASAATAIEWNETTVNVIDTPGHVDFTVEVERSLRVLDGAILVLCAVGGVQSQSLTVDRQMKRYHVPRIAFINKMDRTGANPDDVIQQIQEKLDTIPLPLQMPMGAGADFNGIVDLVNMQAVYFEGKQGEDVRRAEIPAEFQEQAVQRRMHVLETLSLYSDELMMALLEDEDFPLDKIKTLIREATLSHEITPVLMGTAFKNQGVQELLDGVIDYLPAPLDREIEAIDYSKPKGESEDVEQAHILMSNSNDDPFVGMAFKTVVEAFGQLTYVRVYQGVLEKGGTYKNARTGRKVRFGRLVRMHANDREEIETAEAGDIVAVVGVDCASGDTFCGDGISVALENIFVPDPVIRLSIEPLKRDDAVRMGKALQRFRREDPTFQVTSDPDTGETLIAGMGQLHLEVYLERIRREYRCECSVGEPKVAYRECPTKEVAFNFKHKKQTGGSGQYAHVVGRMVPLEEDAEDIYQFEDKITGGRIPKQYIPKTNQGFQRGLEKGPLCGCEVVGVKMILEDGSYHEVDSSEMAFQTCGFNCMRDVLKKARIVLQEPIMKIEVETPEEYQGSVAGHLASKRGIMSSSDVRSGVCYIVAEVPLAQMFDYANELRSLTQGKSSFSMEFFAYRKVPTNLQEEVVTQRLADQKERLAMAR